jgi:FkbM family methyltransferase
MTIRDHLATASPKLAGHAFDAPLAIYGAGGAGRSIAANLRAKSIPVESFIDAGAAPSDVRDGIPTYTLAAWLDHFDPAEKDALISLHNPDHDVAPVIEILTGAGFRNVLTMVDYVNAVDDTEYRYWLRPASFYRDKKEEIDAAYHLMADQVSREWMEASLRLRLLGDYKGLPPPSREDIYASHDLPRWLNPMRLMDCGAFDGDSIENYKRAGYQFESLIAFEPDPANYETLAERCSDLNATLLPCAVSDRARRVSFASGQGKSSRIDEQGGDDIVQCVGIDQAFPNFAPTLIKLEVEGVELPVLEGAIRTLQQHRPGLAIGAYHLPEHLWELPLFIQSLDLGYRMYLRGHAHNNYALILYCLRQ